MVGCDPTELNDVRETLVLTGKIQSQVVDLVVDTASQACVMSTTFYDSLSEKPPTAESAQLQGAAGLVQAHFCRGVKIELAGKTYLENVFVAPIKDPFLLGLNFMRKHGCQMNIKALKLWLENSELPLRVREEAATNPLPRASYSECRMIPLAIRRVLATDSLPLRWIEDAYSMEDLRRLQEADPDLSLVQGWLNKVEPPTSEDLSLFSSTAKHLWVQRESLLIHQGVLFYRWINDKKTAGETLKLIVPRALIHEVFQVHHDLSLAGHLGIHRTIAKVREGFHWVGLSRDIHNLVAECPQCSHSKGLSVRLGGALKLYQAGIQGQSPERWKKLPQPAAAVRASPDSSTGCTSNYLMLGRDVTGPADITFGSPRPEHPTSPSKYITELEDSLWETHRHARSCLKVDQEHRKRDNDIRCKTRNYEAGEVVLGVREAAVPGRSKKLLPVWQGPWLVVEALSPVFFRVRNQKREWIVHHDKLKPCHDRALPGWLRRLRHHLQRGEPLPEPVRRGQVRRPREIDEAALEDVKRLFETPRRIEEPEEQTTQPTRAGRRPVRPRHLDDYVRE